MISDMARGSTGLNDAHSQSIKRQLVACQSCTTRKLRCDKATPSCSTCTEKGYICNPFIPLRTYTRPSTDAELSHRPKAGNRIACTSCASRKVSCDKALPSCSGCATKGLVCTPRFSTRRRRREVSELQAPDQSSFSIDPSLSFALPGRGETTEPNYGPLDDQGDVNAIPFGCGVHGWKRIVSRSRRRRHFTIVGGNDERSLDQRKGGHLGGTAALWIVLSVHG